MTKFHTVVAALPEDVACSLDFSHTDYDSLKASLIESLKANKHQMIEEALSSMSLSGKRPTQLIVDIKRKFSDIGLTVDDAIVKSRLLSAFPQNLRSTLVGHDNLPLEQYAKVADSMLAVSSKETPFVGHVSSSSEPREQYHPRGQQRFQRRPFSQQRPKICNAHIYYASKARTCRAWCQWPAKKGEIIPSGKQTPYQSRSSSPVN
ncbi:MAG: hypothetical protein AAFP88_02425 [Bacteroidota bacterium]